MRTRPGRIQSIAQESPDVSCLRNHGSRTASSLRPIRRLMVRAITAATTMTKPTPPTSQQALTAISSMSPLAFLVVPAGALKRDARVRQPADEVGASCEEAVNEPHDWSRFLPPASNHVADPPRRQRDSSLRCRPHTVSLGEAVVEAGTPPTQSHGPHDGTAGQRVAR